MTSSESLPAESVIDSPSLPLNPPASRPRSRVEEIQQELNDLLLTPEEEDRLDEDAAKAYREQVENAEK
jgi:ubiquitin-protein ligase